MRGSVAALPAAHPRRGHGRAQAGHRLTSLASVQIAATPMVPAPTKRTRVAHIACATSLALPAAGCSQVNTGTSEAPESLPRT